MLYNAFQSTIYPKSAPSRAGIYTPCNTCSMYYMGCRLYMDSAFHPPWDGKMSISFRAE